MLVKEYRLAMPLTVEEYRIGQLYMIAKHSHEQSEKGEGVEVVTNEPFYHEVHGQVSVVNVVVVVVVVVGQTFPRTIGKGKRRGSSHQRAFRRGGGCSCLPIILTSRRRQWMWSLINPFTSNTCSSWASKLLLLDVHDRPTF